MADLHLPSLAWKTWDGKQRPVPKRNGVNILFGLHATEPLRLNKRRDNSSARQCGSNGERSRLCTCFGKRECEELLTRCRKHGEMGAGGVSGCWNRSPRCNKCLLFAAVF
jgi:hypothetical protein